MRHGGCRGCSPARAGRRPGPTGVKLRGYARLWRTLSETTVPAWLGGPRAGGLTDQVVALGDVRGPTGGIRVRRAGGRQIAVELVQVAADRMPPVAVAEHPAQPVGLAQPGGGAEDVADRDRAAQHGGGVLVHRDPAA